MNKIKKIAVLGPESTGKTQLCMQLAEYFKTEWVPEYAREYLKNNNYSFDDVVHCLEEQLLLEEKKERVARQFLFCDTELINFKVWFSDVFKKTPSGLEEKLENHKYELTLLTCNDIPFEADALRVNGHRRDFFFDWYKKELEEYNKPYEIIKGFGPVRLERALEAIAKHLS